MHKIILDTDIGTDVDDILTLAFLLASPEAQLLGVTTAYGDTLLRANLVHRTLALAGRTDVPVAAGDGEPLTPDLDLFWLGHEGRNAGVTSSPHPGTSPLSAEDLILAQVDAHPGEVVLCAVAPLTNVARAILKSPTTMAKVRQIYVMGGVFGLHDPNFGLPVAEHNIRCDPDAARVVFSSGLPITLFPLDVTVQVPFTLHDVEELAGGTGDLTRLLHDELQTWLAFIREHHGRDFTHMHDPLTAAAILTPRLVTRSLPVGIDVETRGEFTLGMTVPRAQASVRNVELVQAIDVSGFHELFLSRLHALTRARAATRA